MSFVHLVFIILAALIVFFLISVKTDHYNLTYIINFFVGGSLGYTIKNGLLKILPIVLVGLVIVLLLSATEAVSINFSSYLVTIVGFIFGRYLGRRNQSDQ